ncbi:hypothetical protein MATL_G00233190 [Megalops atlanticus]|uniref:Uncharacterized protein n=1 Tax=Megalops atlanticus TaxID=7932 RepID=A0A9D3T296_MEGAT|nr:hypothetical protein MATL_G00233190 [Megalops atlanticus]
MSSGRSFPMNNLSDSGDWNIRPGQGGNGDWSKWTYALVVPMLAVGAYRWVWERNFQKEIQKVKFSCEKEMKATTMVLTRQCKTRTDYLEGRIKTLQEEKEREKESFRMQRATALLGRLRICC